MLYENKVIVFPMGATINKANFNTCVITVQNRRKTLKIGNAIRLRRLTENDTFKNCKCIFEGTLFNGEKIIPYSIFKAFVYVGKTPLELLF